MMTSTAILIISNRIYIVTLVKVYENGLEKS